MLDLRLKCAGFYDMGISYHMIILSDMLTCSDDFFIASVT